MKQLGFDTVDRDGAGNIIGVLRGTGSAEPIMVNTHLDHVGVGEESEWPFPPFEGAEAEGRIWGRGAVDIKGPLAAQVYAVGELARAGRRPPGDVWVTAVVMEEIGGLGARYLARNLTTPCVIVGEPSRNRLMRGHRGRTELLLTVTGRSVHASIPDRGVNPLEVIAAFISAMPGLRHVVDGDLGASSVAPTLLRTDQSSPNVIPGRAWLTCDWRNVPGETGESIRRLLQELADRSLIEGGRAEVSIPGKELTSYTGHREFSYSYHPTCCLGPEDRSVKAAESLVARVTGEPAVAGVWKFATDGGHFAEAGMKVLGLGPGDETLAHTVQESIGLDELETGRRLFLELICDEAFRASFQSR
jgi:putative selenium metabolism hydrolase